MTDSNCGPCFFHGSPGSLLFILVLAFHTVVMAGPQEHDEHGTDSVLNSAVAFFNAGKFNRAYAAASSTLETRKTRSLVQLRFLRALARMKAGLPSDPSDWIFVMSSAKDKGLAAHAAWYMGLQLWNRGKRQSVKKAFDLAGPYLRKVTVPGRFGLDASSMLVRGMLASGKYRAACSLATSVAKAYYRKRSEPVALWTAASCLAHAGWKFMRSGNKPTGRQYLTRSARLCRMISVLWSEHWASPKALGLLNRLKKSGFGAGRLPPGPLLDRAHDLVNHPRYKKDMLRLWRIRKLLARGPADPAGAELELLWAKMSMSRRRYKSAWRATSRVLRRSKDKEFRARASLIRAQMVGRTNRAGAIKIYLDLVKRWPKSLAASRAMYLAGELTRRGGDTDEASDLFLRCIGEYDIEQRADPCRWGLAWIYYLNGQMEPALEWLAPLSSRDGPEHEGQQYEEEKIDWFDSRGSNLSEMARYWTARIHQRLSHQHRAEQLYRLVTNDYPFSYYSTLAWARLAQMGCPPELEMEAQKDPVPDSVGPEVGAAIAYYKMGLWTEARLTLVALSRHDFSSLQDRRWTAWVYDQLGNYVRSHRMAPVAKLGGMLCYPEQGWLFDAKLAFPRAFSQYVEQTAKAQHVPSSLVYSIVRAESGFWPRAHSAAHARGLTQVISRTAWAMAKKIKMKRFRRWRLYDPQVSILIGSAYLSGLLARYKNPLLAVAAYNAGEPSVNRWLNRRGQMELDEFIEEIPYSETSRYTRKVASWWAIYRILYDDEVKLPLDVDFDLHYMKNKN